jgi:hypothetical protein
MKQINAFLLLSEEKPAMINSDAGRGLAGRRQQEATTRLLLRLHARLERMLLRRSVETHDVNAISLASRAV